MKMCAFANMSRLPCFLCLCICCQPEKGEHDADEHFVWTNQQITRLFTCDFFSSLSLPPLCFSSCGGRSSQSVSLGATRRNKAQANTKQDGFKEPYVCAAISDLYSFSNPLLRPPAAIKLQNYMFYHQQPLSPEYWITEIKYE